MIPMRNGFRFAFFICVIRNLSFLTKWMKQGRIPYKRTGKRIYFNKEVPMFTIRVDRTDSG